MDGYLKVLEFHKSMGLATENTIFGEVDRDDEGIALGAKLRQILIMEESHELFEGMYENDKLKTLDGICDLLYVTFGTAIEAGISAENLEKAFAAVHESNMSKACKTYEEAEETINTLPEKDKGKIVSRDGLYFVYNEKGKLIKSVNYKPVDLTPYG